MNYVPEVGDTVTVSMAPVTGEVAYTDPVMREIRVGKNYYKLDRYNVALVKKKVKPLAVGDQLTYDHTPPVGTKALFVDGRMWWVRELTADGWRMIAGDDTNFGPDVSTVSFAAMNRGYTIIHLPSE